MSLLIGHIIYLTTGRTGFGRVLRYALAFTHFSFMGIPVIDALLGPTGNLYYVMFLIPVRIAYYVLTPQLFGVSSGKGGTKQFLKTLFNPCLCAVLVGLAAWITGFQFPSILQYCVNSLNKICSPLGLLLCGMILGSYDLKKLLNFRYLRIPLLRTVAMPLIFLGISRLLLLAGLDRVLCDMTVIYSALPCASLTAVYAVQYEPDPEVVGLSNILDRELGGRKPEERSHG